MITRNELALLLTYHPDGGYFIWNVSRGGIKAGSTAGTPTCHGYVQIKVNGKFYKAHRLAWLAMTGEDLGDAEIDHINGDGFDNTWSNLRKATRCQNACNQGVKKSNKSGFKGVSFDRRRNAWIARVRDGGKRIWVGSFPSPEEAAAAYQQAAKSVHGEFFRAA
mgnify:CR=1 FL=1